MEPTIILEKRVAGLNQRVLAAFVTQASREVGLAGAVTVMVTDSREMRRLNFRFRDKDQSTDVLSFPAPGFVNGFAGDIAICLDVAARNARTLKHSTAEEVRVLVLHGILHLAGYDLPTWSGFMRRLANFSRENSRTTLIHSSSTLSRSSG